MDQGNKNHPQPPPLPGGGSGEPSSSGPPPVVEDASRASDPGETLADKGTGDPTAEFLRRAGAAIALDRGINARSRVKLAAIADELDLSEEQFDAAMEQLLGGAKAGDKREQSLTREELRQLRRRKRNFHNHVGETLMALPHGVLTSSMEQMLVRAGPEQFDLPEEEAQADVVQLAKKLRVRRITLEEAERHVAQLADYAVKPDGVLRPDVRKRIIAEASRWGLTPDQVQPILRDALSRARVGERRAQMRMVALVSGSAAVLVGVLGMIAWMAFSRALPEVDPPSVAVSEDDEVEAPTEEGEAASGVPLTRPKRLEVPAWWNDDLASYIANVRLRVPALESDLYQLRSPDANQRGAAYDRLLQATASGDLDDQQRTVLTGLFAAAYAVDPSEECAHRLRDGMMRIASAPSDGLPKRFSEYELSIWVAHTAFSALLNADISAERQSLLLDAIDRTFETALDRDLPPVQMQRQILGAAGGYLYRSLTRHAAKDVLLAVDLHKELLARVRTYLNPHAEDRLAANYLRQVLP